MRGHRRLSAVLVAAVAVLVAALVATGCGSDEQVKRNNAYVHAVNRAQSDFARTIKRLNAQVTDHSTPRQDRATLRSFTRAVDAVVASLRRIDPPGPVAGLHRRLVSDMQAYATEVKAAAASLSSDDAQHLIDAQQRLLKATTRVSRQINATIGAINDKLQS